MKPLRLSQAFTGFLLDKEASGKSQYTLRNYRYTFQKVKCYLQKRDPRLPDVERADWIGFFAWLQRQTIGGAAARDELLSAKTINNVYTDLHAFYNWAVALDLVERNIIATIERPDYQKYHVRPFSKADVEAILSACQYSKPYHNHTLDTRNERPTADRDRAIVLVLLSTGIRNTELRTIVMRDVDLQQRTLLVKGKSRGRDPKVRTVYFGLRTRRALWRYLAVSGERTPDEPLFISTRGDMLTRSALYSLIVRLGERAGVRDCKPHRFRHTFAVNYLRNSGDVLTLQGILGHTSLKMVQHYARIAAEDCQRVHQQADPVDNWKL